MSTENYAVTGSWVSYRAGQASLVLQNLGHAPLEYRTGALAPAANAGGLVLEKGESREVYVPLGQNLYLRSRHSTAPDHPAAACDHLFT